MYKDIDTCIETIRKETQLLGVYLNSIALYLHGDLSSALDHALWLDEAFGLGGFPDVVMLEASLRQRLPANDPRRQQPSTDQLRRLYETRSNRSAELGIMRRTIARNSSNESSSLTKVGTLKPTSLWSELLPQLDVPGLVSSGRASADTPVPLRSSSIPPVSFSLPWEEFGIHLQVLAPRSIPGAWALNRVLAGEYQEARDILDESGHYATAGQWIADMALNYYTERWNDLRSVAHRARVQTPVDLGFDDEHDDLQALNVRQVQDLGNLMSGLADASLGHAAVARSTLQSATESTTGAIAARAAYVTGLTYRPDDQSTASKFISQAWRQHNDPRYEAALRDDSQTLRVTTEQMIDQRSDKWDVTTEPDPAMQLKREAAEMRESYRIRAEELLDRQVGMEDVKANVRRLITNIRVTQERKRRGGNETASNYNLVLTGPPGTGKSTIVDVITLHLAALGIVDDPMPMVTHRENYVAETVGGSAIKTKNTIQAAVGKVLFFDEFYALVQQEQGPNLDQFGKEALDTIVAETETRIGQLVFIVAGYGPDMDRVMKTNDGLSSRFPRRIDFRTYTLDEIAQIAQIQADRENMVIDDEAMAFLSDELGEARKLNVTGDRGMKFLDQLGNGRFARNLVETATEYQSERVAASGTDLTEVSHEELFTLTLDDITRSFYAHLDDARKH